MIFEKVDDVNNENISIKNKFKTLINANYSMNYNTSANQAQLSKL
jgi:hypothetical protein